MRNAAARLVEPTIELLREMTPLTTAAALGDGRSGLGDGRGGLGERSRRAIAGIFLQIVNSIISADSQLNSELL